MKTWEDFWVMVIRVFIWFIWPIVASVMVYNIMRG